MPVEVEVLGMTDRISQDSVMQKDSEARLLLESFLASLLASTSEGQLKMNGEPQLHIFLLPMQTPSKVGFRRAKLGAVGVSRSAACASTTMSSAGTADESRLQAKRVSARLELALQ